MPQLIIAILVIVLVIYLIAFLIPIAIGSAFALLIGTPGGFVGVLTGWMLCQRKARTAAEQLTQKNPIGSIVRFGYAKDRPAIVWELDETKLSNYIAEQEFEFLRWAAAILAAVFVLLVTLFFVSLNGTTWEGLIESLYGGIGFNGKLGVGYVSMSPINISNWWLLEWLAFIVSFCGIIYILRKFLPSQGKQYNQTVKLTAEGLIRRKAPTLSELSVLYSQAWEATELASERIGRTGSVTLLASVENNWDALKSENLLSILQSDDWAKFRSVCEGIRTDAAKLDEYALKYLRGEATPEEEPPPTSKSETENAFALLGIPDGSSPDVIKNIFRKLAKIYHPDMGDAPSDEHFKKINEAYECLRRELNF